jgi:hypothetical protein
VKFQKMDQKQGPQVIILVVVAVGVFGWVGFSAINGAAPPKKQPTKTAEGSEPVRVAQAPANVLNGGGPGSPATGTAAVTAAEGAATSGAALPSPIPGGAPLPGIYSADPFRSLVPAQSKTQPAPSAPHRASSGANRRMAISKLFGGLPNVGDAFPGLAGGDVTKPAPPAPPARPELELTGVIDAEKGGTDMALVTIDQQQRILQVGDVLPNNYHVAKIALDGVLLVSGKDRFFVALGKKTEPAVGKPAESPATALPSVRS